MEPSRRDLLKCLGALPVAAAALPAACAAQAKSTTMLPDKAGFSVHGTYLDAAYTHPVSNAARSAYAEFMEQRASLDPRTGPEHNPRNLAVERFARLIHAEPKDIAVVPSTMEGENLVTAAVGLHPKAGVVTDGLHYDASVVMYEQLARQGIPVTVVKPKGGGIEFDDMARAIAKGTRLVAISLVSNVTGFQHDLHRLCELAHSRGALVYADIIQAAGAMPIDVKASGVDFCACGTYKWLMGDFGTAFLYVRPDRLGELRRPEIGWRQIHSQPDDLFPFDDPALRAEQAALRWDAAGIFEVSTPAWGALACVAESLNYIESIGVEAIARHRKPMADYLAAELPRLGFEQLTPAGTQGPVLAFGYKGAQRFSKPLHDAGVRISIYENRIRISPSVYNSMQDVQKLRDVLVRA